MITHIAFDFNRKEVRELIELTISEKKRKKVISHPAHVLLNRPVLEVWHIWLRFSFKYVSYRKGVLILKTVEIGNEETVDMEAAA